MIEYAVAELGAEKILFGTDMPLLDPHVQAAKVRGRGDQRQRQRRRSSGAIWRVYWD